MDINKLIGNTTTMSFIDFNLVVKSDNLRYWSIRNATFEKGKVELHMTFEKDGITSSLDKHFNTIMDAVKYFYDFLRTI